MTTSDTSRDGDRAILELAAKAAGIRVHHWRTDGQGIVVCDPVTDDDGTTWNPLESDGDALRLAVKLGLHITHNRTSGEVYAERFIGDVCGTGYFAAFGHDPYSATRLAIVRAAAEIGRASIATSARSEAMGVAHG